MAKKCRTTEHKECRTRFGRVWYKVTHPDGTALYKYKFRYHLPKNGRPGKWHIHTFHLFMCSSGFHVTQRPGCWANSDSRLFRVEATGFRKGVPSPKKMVCRSMRLVKEIKRGTVLWKKLMRR